MKLDLNGNYTLFFYDAAKITADTPVQLDELKLNSYSVRVPANVETYLSDLGLLPRDLYFGNNVLRAQDFELYDWWLKKTFVLPKGFQKERAELIFHGVDCFADYFLNGEKLGESRNMFVPHSFFPNTLLREGENSLFVHIKSPVLSVWDRRPDAATFCQPANFDGLFARKAAHMYGWDIAPRVLSAGIYRGVELVEHSECRIREVYIDTLRITEENTRADLTAAVYLDMPPTLLRKAKLRIEGTCGDSRFRKEIPAVKFNYVRCNFSVTERLKLWWPYGYGDPNLYDVKISLLLQEKTVAEKDLKVGIRKILLDHCCDPKQPRFSLSVNGIPVTAMGTNWICADALHANDAARMPTMLGYLSDLHCNMVRCWGGNVYEPENFYDYCDEHGILVWQDFAMACAVYPQSEGFLQELRDEFTHIIKRYRNHASLALFCGDNECDSEYIANGGGMDPNKNIITRKLLPELISRHAPFVNFIPSSPYISEPIYKSGRYDLMPENHLWVSRSNFKSQEYQGTRAKFISEVGYHGCPNRSSMERFLSAEKLWPWKGNDEWLTHAACTDGLGQESPYAYRIKLMADQIRELFGFEPDNLDDFIAASQISQAEANKFFIEMVRQRKGEMSGILWWNLMDCWPQFSDAVIDYYGGKKLAYDFIKRSQSPVQIICCEQNGWTSDILLCNDTRATVRGSYLICDADSGSTLAAGDFSCEAGKNRTLCRLNLSNGIPQFLLMRLKTEDGRTIYNHYCQSHPPLDFDWYRKNLKKLRDFTEQTEK